ncbi:M24 family metallopeptidase [Alkaliphilus transvaalensis]|uniref:M24 family metallopeptidase n=1 Tax=Alkaliphilus transvaalensis TaxID=114628 RepID=UPI0004789A94|nr:M24 family metallopeptidase [Alkaliphilus transvaalensis]
MENTIKESMKILPLKEQYIIMETWLKERLDNLLPSLMKREGIDMWIILAREYNEDPIFLSLIPPLQRTASRLSCLMFYLDSKGELECLNLGRPSPYLLKFYCQKWDSKQENQWDCIKRLVEEKNPNKIAINVSQNFALADGLTKGLFDELVKVLGEKNTSKLVSAEKLCIGWLETRTESEIEMYRQIYHVAIRIIEEAFSNKVIEVGRTTTREVEWWMMERINDLGLKSWFTPTVDLQRRGENDSRLSNQVILEGDLLHCDVGLEYLGLSTDTQRLAYVLKADEKDVPQGLQKALTNCNQFQDIVASNFTVGKTGNQILLESLQEAQEKNIKAMLYTHPIGTHGHGIGPTIGLWDQQHEVPIWGDYPLYHNTCYALELNTAVNVPEWGYQEVYVYLEETVAFTEEGIIYLSEGRDQIIEIRN